jgi:cellulose biosynthesis protein BcsQ
MKTVCFFNNKGGVGKTTLLCNAASFLAQHRNQRVLLIDADPQCNATQLILPDDKLLALYPLELGARSPERSTLRKVLKPISEGDSNIDSKITVCPAKENRFSVDVLAGDPGMSLLEDRLSRAWLDFMGGDLGGLRRTNWITEVFATLGDKYDIAFVDVGPSLGALNRSVLVGTEYFVAPLGCDIFSVAGMRNIAEWLKGWLDDYKHGILRTEQAFGDAIKKHKIATEVATMGRFAGYTVQQYIAKAKEGVRRPTASFERILKTIPKSVSTHLKPYAAADAKGKLSLGDVPNMFSLVPMAQTAHCPIHALASADGIRGAHYAQRDRYVEFIEGMVDEMSTSIGLKV